MLVKTVTRKRSAKAEVEAELRANTEAKGKAEEREGVTAAKMEGRFLVQDTNFRFSSEPHSSTPCAAKGCKTEDRL
jgi:hypothetical protein